MSNIKEIVDGYFTMWNETDDASRKKVIERVWSDNAVSVDPMVRATGHQEIDSMVAKVQESYPGHKFSLVGDIVEHHDRVRFDWRMKNDKGEVQLSGIDCVRLSSDGRIEDLTGFFDATPA